jgi:hypothetical protein
MWGFHGGKDSSPGLLGCNALQCCDKIDDGGSMDLRNVGILPQHYAASQPRRPRLKSVSLFAIFFTLPVLRTRYLVKRYTISAVTSASDYTTQYIPTYTNPVARYTMPTVQFTWHFPFHTNVQRSFYLTIEAQPQRSFCDRHVLCSTEISNRMLTYSMVQDILWKVDSYSTCQRTASFLYGTRRFITVFTKGRHQTLSWARWITFAHQSLCP